jgi:thiol:disulfide interchange protein
MNNKIVLYFRTIIVIIMILALTISCVNIYNIANQFLNTEQIAFIVITYFALIVMLSITLFDIFKLRKLENEKIDIDNNICH